jgi:hypothetical protein
MKKIRPFTSGTSTTASSASGPMYKKTLAHGYFKVDLEIAWKIIHNDLPDLTDKIETMLSTHRLS